ncbi:MAG: hypothetical protein KJZ78_07580 [Bryobacteraceae bacterium]|nr:hypothetical protein [Bryobacteraceae bacterium]
MCLTGRLILLAALMLFPGEAQLWNRDRKLPDGRSQKEAILKAEYKRNLKDVAELAQLSAELQTELEENSRHVLSVSSLKKIERIEALAKDIRKRLKRY